MNRYVTALLTLAIMSPSIAQAQLSSHERERAQELARIQAKADADERAKERKTHYDMAKANCESSGRYWDRANEFCKPK